jgi:hypothetical protein
MPGMAGLVALYTLVAILWILNSATFSILRRPPRRTPAELARDIERLLASGPRVTGLDVVETLRCPCCFTSIDVRPLRCDRCSTAHHPECFAESGRCTIYACGGARSRA